jgi:hypothetical protein
MLPVEGRGRQAHSTRSGDAERLVPSNTMSRPANVIDDAGWKRNPGDQELRFRRNAAPSGCGTRGNGLDIGSAYLLPAK